MNRLLSLLLLLLLTSTAHAQEFKLKINAQLPKQSSFIILPVFLGYDAAAADSIQEMDPRWKQRIPFLDDSLSLYEQDNFINNGTNLLFRDPDSLFGSNYRNQDSTLHLDSNILSRVDIRNKPDSTSFEMRWSLWVSSALPDQSIKIDDRMQLTWNPASIPEQVTHLYLSYENGDRILDMKNASSVVIWDDSMFNHRLTLDGYQNLSITLFYNREPLGVEFVQYPGIRMRVYPNPAVTHATVSLDLAEITPIVVDVLDVRGTQLYSRTTLGTYGRNELTLSKEELGCGAGTYFVRVRVGDRWKVQQVVFQ